jgi:hypothetical protein
MIDKVLNPSIVGVAIGRLAKLPAWVFLQELARPIADVERRIGEYVVGLEVGAEVAEEGVGGLRAEVGLDRVDGVGGGGAVVVASSWGTEYGVRFLAWRCVVAGW